MENPYEPKEPGPYTARSRAPQRRGNDYHLPPIGNARTLDERHLRREQWMGWLMLLLLIGLPCAYLLALQFDWL